MKIFLLYLNIGLAITIIELVFLKNEPRSKEIIEEMRAFLNIGGMKALLYLAVVAFPFVILSAPISFILRIFKMPFKLIKKIIRKKK